MTASGLIGLPRGRPCNYFVVFLTADVSLANESSSGHTTKHYYSYADRRNSCSEEQNEWTAKTDMRYLYCVQQFGGIIEK